MKLKPSPTADRTLAEYRTEALAKPLGSIVRTAKTLRISKQAVWETLRKFPHRIADIPKVEQAYFICKICGCEIPRSLKAPKRKVCCRDCADQRLYICIVCQSAFRYIGTNSAQKVYCPKHHYLKIKKIIEKIRKEGGPRFERFKAMKRKNVKNLQIRKRKRHGQSHKI